ncbi:hypothetical protein FRC14_008066 [Serendipita sp. 396]|nr:hypothetical protein FRC14_008066 [Serendipita sp. 396]
MDEEDDEEGDEYLPEWDRERRGSSHLHQGGGGGIYTSATSLGKTRTQGQYELSISSMEPSGRVGGGVTASGSSSRAGADTGAGSSAGGNAKGKKVTMLGPDGQPPPKKKRRRQALSCTGLTFDFSIWNHLSCDKMMVPFSNAKYDIHMYAFACSCWDTRLRLIGWEPLLSSRPPWLTLVVEPLSLFGSVRVPLFFPLRVLPTIVQYHQIDYGNSDTSIMVPPGGLNFPTPNSQIRIPNAPPLMRLLPRRDTISLESYLFSYPFTGKTWTFWQLGIVVLRALWDTISDLTIG